MIPRTIRADQVKIGQRIWTTHYGWTFVTSVFLTLGLVKITTALTESLHRDYAQVDVVDYAEGGE